MDVAAGEIHGLLGQNGAGKSTLMRVLAGSHPDYSGTVALDGEVVDMSSPSAAQSHGVAIIYQEFSLVPHLTVAENIMLGREPGRVGYSSRSVRAEAAKVLENIGMAGELSLDDTVGGLSTSTQQRIEIAKALSRDARVLVLDEPTSRLDGAERTRLFALMNRLAAAGTSLVFISHFLEEVLAVTSRLTVLRDGYAVERGRSEDYSVETLSHALLGQDLQLQEDAERTQGPDSVGECLFAAHDVHVGQRVRGVSLSLHAGEIVSLAGLMGSGRTTFVKSLIGAIRMTGGHVELRGSQTRFRNPTQALRAGVALVPEDRRAQGLVGALPARDNIVMMSVIRQPSRFGFIRPAALRGLAKRAVQELEVRPADDSRLASTFSGGNQQKLLLARAVLSGVEVMIVDQPTAGVDVGTKAQIHRILRELANEGRAILVVSDEIDELLTVGDRILVMREGSLAGEYTRGQLDRAKLIAELTVRTAYAA
jgi:ribose transport system ATP-binding protein